MNRKLRFFVLMLALTFGTAWGQDNSAPQSGDTPQDNSQQPTPAIGQENPPVPITENPPLSGLDLPGLEPHAAPLSYLQVGAAASQMVDSNIANSLGQGTVQSLTEGVGSLTLQRLWSHYGLAVDYLGGVGYYNAQGLGWKLLQEMDLEQKITWRRGQLAIRDSFRYLPEGNFGVQFGAVGVHGITSVGADSFTNAFWGNSALAGLGQVPRISNLSLVDLTEELTPKSAVTVAGGYTFTHFTGNPVLGTVPLVNNSFLGSSQTSAQAGYNRILSAHDQIALVYGYQGFDFSAQGTAFHSHVIQGMYGHRITGRLDFLIGAGPQITKLNFGTSTDTRIGVAGRGQLRYRFTRTIVELTYDRFETNGAGFFAGAQSDIARLTLSRPVSRKWTGYLDFGYTRDSRLQPLFNNAVLANTYYYGFAGIGARRIIGHTWTLFANYQFNELAFDRTFCTTQGLSSCSRISQRHIAAIGLQWTPRPIRLD
jgi:hypothetical protein